MIQMDDIELSQNSALSAILLYEFSLAYYEKSNKQVDLMYFFPVLPMLYEKDICEKIWKKKGVSSASLLKLISENEGYFSELDQHVNSYFVKTCQAINLASQARIISVVQDEFTILPLKQKKNLKSDDEDVWQMQLSAKRIGRWFSEVNPLELYNYLKLTL